MSQETAKVIAKITNLEEFTEVCNQLRSNPNSQDIDIYLKIEDFIRKTIENYHNDKNEQKKEGHDENTVKKLDRERIGKLFEFLMTLDRDLPWEDFFSDHGADLFVMFFKLTFYDIGIKYSVYNNNPQDKDDTKEAGIADHENLCWLITNVQKLESQVNYVLNNIILKQTTAVKDKFQMLVNTADLIYSPTSLKRTKRIAKVMIYFSRLYSLVDEKNIVQGTNNGKHKFLMDSLYALGGLLKVEAKSFLKTIEEGKDQFKPVCPLVNKDNAVMEADMQYLRTLNEDDLEYFELGFPQIIVQFVKSISKGLDKQINNDTFNTLLDLTYGENEHMVAEMQVREAEKLDKLLCSHFVSLFLLDVLGFCQAYFVRAGVVAKEEGDHKQIYDHRKPIDPKLDGPAVLIGMQPIISGFAPIIDCIVGALDAVWASPFDLLKLWCIKYAEDPHKGRADRSGQDSYVRTHYYDGQGVAVFTYLHLRQQILAVFLGGSADSPPEESANLDSLGFLRFHKHSFVYEVCTPSICFLIEHSVSHPNSATLRQMGLEMLTYLLHMAENEQSQLPSFGHYTKDAEATLQLLSSLFSIVGVKGSSKLSLKLVYRTLSLVSSNAGVVSQIRHLIKLDPNVSSDDKALSVLISSVIKPLLQERTQDDQILDFVIDELFPRTLDVLGEDSPHVLGMAEQIKCSLNLYVLIKGRFKEKPAVQKLKNEIQKKYLDSLLQAIESSEKENNEDLEEANKMDDENHLKAPKLGEHKYRAQLLANLKYLFEYAQE